MDIFWIPDLHNNRCGSATLVEGIDYCMEDAKLKNVSLALQIYENGNKV